MARELWELQNLQALPLDLKVKKTQQRIREWVDYFGEDGVFVSFSGGKDSTVLLHIAREMYPNIKAMFIDTGLEYPEVRQFVKKWDNVDWVKPQMNFRQVLERYGIPLISKEVALSVYEARKYLESIAPDSEAKKPVYYQSYRKLCGIGEYAKPGSEESERSGKPNRHVYACTKYKYLLDAPFEISGQCCYSMKKYPNKKYMKETGRKPIYAMLAEESRLRTQKWLKTGCNAFEEKKATSMPMAFWREQDVLTYIYEKGLPIADVYGDVVKENDVEGQLDFEDINAFGLGTPKLKTTGAYRTGCIFCLFGIHLERNPNRLEQIKETHPSIYEYIMKPESDGGLGYKEKIDWINEHGGMNIKY